MFVSGDGELTESAIIGIAVGVTLGVLIIIAIIIIILLLLYKKRFLTRYNILVYN